MDVKMMNEQSRGQAGTGVGFSLPLQDKLSNLDSKSNKLIEKVLAIQQQIQKYAQTENKEFIPFGLGSQLQNNNTQSVLNPRRDSFAEYNWEHQQYVRKMAVIGKNKVKMIESLQNQISTIQHRLNGKSNDPPPLVIPKSNPIFNNQGHFAQLENVTSLNSLQNLQNKITGPPLQIQKKALESKFLQYYKHKNDLFKHSRSEKFSFRNIKYLTKESLNEDVMKTEREVRRGEENVSKEVGGGLGEQSPQHQLLKLKQQFTAYQQRTARQLQSYKQRLNQNILEKEMLKKELEREKYDHLKDKLFGNKRTIRSSKMLTQRTAREFGDEGMHEGRYVNEKVGDGVIKREVTSNRVINDVHDSKPSPLGNMLSIPFPKTQRPTNDNSSQNIEDLSDLQQLREQLNVKYVQENEQNEEIQELRQRLRESDMELEEVRMKLEKNHGLYSEELQELHLMLEEKEKLLQQFEQTSQYKQKQIQQLKQQINQMSQYIMSLKQQNEHQQEEIEEFKSVMEEFVEEVNRLREEGVVKSQEIVQLRGQMEVAERINLECEGEIAQLRERNTEMGKEMEEMIKELEIKQRKVIELERVLEVEREKESNVRNIKNNINLRDQLQLITTVDALKVENDMLNQLRQEHLQHFSQLKVQADNIAKEKQQAICSLQFKVQELEESLQLTKGTISQQVEQEVNEGIRTFLRYRRHSCRIVEGNLKAIVYHRRCFMTKEEIDGLRVHLQFSQSLQGGEKQIKNNKMGKQQVKLTNGGRKNVANESAFTLRKLIDSKFTSSVSNITSEQVLRLKFTVIKKLVKFVVEFFHEQSLQSTISTKSIKGGKKYHSLLPENIILVMDIQGEKVESPQEVICKMMNDKAHQGGMEWHFIYRHGDTRQQSQSKKDKSMIYLSPQVLLSMNESEHSYTWTLGIIIDQILNNRPFYSKIEEIISRRDNYQFANRLGYESEGVRKVGEVLSTMLRKNFKQRVGLERVSEELGMAV